ncbi:hypothetical protein I553_3805 [Mycobacterium xenopi 4042]|uniref:Uncharacterized protein n=1 Tax=Mycobacterium xenopi 4042 TaxID=1299334 RepID=X8EYC8_MYCXE|nr:hypothetical protein I553_3805 [Mycobacterium xenopi 4042]
MLLILLAFGVAIAIGIARRTMRTNRSGDHLLFDGATKRCPASYDRRRVCAQGIGLRQFGTGCVQ